LNIIDLIILIILFLGALSGFRRGLIVTAGSFAGLISGIWLAGRHYISFSQFLGERLGLDKLLTKALTPLASSIPVVVPAGPTVQAPASTGWPPSLWGPVYDAQAGIYGSGIAHSLSQTIIKVIAFLLIMALVSWAVMVLASFVSRAARLLLLGGFDRLGGVGFGLAIRALELVVVIGLLTPVVLGFSMSVPGTGGWLQTFYQEWNHSILIPVFNSTWNQAVPVLQNIFRMI
jgi:uncharacterized membrane protein required for colicin V production